MSSFARESFTYIQIVTKLLMYDVWQSHMSSEESCISLVSCSCIVGQRQAAKVITLTHQVRGDFCNRLSSVFGLAVILSFKSS